MSRAYLSLGSNLDPARHLRGAIDALHRRFGTVVLSPVYRTRAVGFDGSDFLNAAAVIETDRFTQRAYCSPPSLGASAVLGSLVASDGSAAPWGAGRRFTCGAVS